MKALLKLLSFIFLLNLISPALFAVETAPTPSPGPGYQDLLNARQALSEGDAEAAEQFFESAVTAEPMNPEYRFERANLYALQHDESYQMGDDLGAARKMRLAAADLEQAVMVRPDYTAARFNLGVVYKKLGKYEKARQEFKEVLRRDPTQAQAKMQIGLTYEDQGFYDEAEVIYQEIKEEFPYSFEVQDALKGLEARRIEDAKLQASERAMRMNSMSAGLSQMSRTGAAQPYGYQDPSGSNNAASMQQALPALGSWALQQFSKKKEPSQ